MKKIIAVVLTSFLLTSCASQKRPIDIKNRINEMKNDESIQNNFDALSSTNMEIESITTEELRQIITTKVFFDFDKSDLSDDAKKAIDTFVTDNKIVESNTKVIVEGHTDIKGSVDYNIALSERRADAVKKHLVRKYGIDASNIECIGFGKEKLEFFGDSKEINAKNRRAVILVNSGDSPASGGTSQE